MPAFVKHALEERSSIVAYKERPAYQQNDNIGWTDRAKLLGTKGNRLLQMLHELASGGVYMKMKHPASRKK
jgi:hypothetical protein